MTALSPKLDALQNEAILDRIVPLLAEPADHEFFRGVIGLQLDACPSAADVAKLVHELLGE